MLHKSIETPSTYSQRPWFSGSTSSQALHSTVPKSMRVASVSSEYPPSSNYYQAYAPFPGPTPFQSHPPSVTIYPPAYAPGWVQAAPQIEVTIGPSGVYSSGGYSYGVAPPPSSHGSSNGEPHYPRKPAPSDSDHHSQHHAPYQLSRNPSLTSIGHVSKLESDRLKAQSRDCSHHPKATIHSLSSSNSSKHNSKCIRLASLLRGRTTEYPCIDWHIWDKMYSSAARDASGQFCATDMELDAFDPPVREPIFIKSVPGKSDGFSIAIQRWGAIRVSARRPGSSITVNDIMLAISLWVMVPIQPEDWKNLDKVFERHVSDAFESRKMCAKVNKPLTGSVKERAQVVDSLFCRVRWDGMVISDDFAESRTVYLRLKDASLR